MSAQSKPMGGAINRLRAALAAATPGPWVNRPTGVVQKAGGEGPIALWDDAPANRSNDYTAIAALRNHADALLELWAACEGMRPHWERTAADFRLEGLPLSDTERLLGALARLNAVEPAPARDPFPVAKDASELPPSTTEGGI